MGHFAGVDYEAITAQNKANYKVLRNSSDIAITYIGIRDIVLVGGGHDPEMIGWVTAAAGHNEGTISRKGRNELWVTGCRHAKAEMEWELKKFSDRKVVHIEQVAV